ncbi:hypothetical protein UFOVP1193_22 [uncultured Caudovirales phage]|uniref:Uncharacterized protein n=1 Tax=uncultured Caudovirales phage TaxID=2100421 RepID=A0A6J5RBI6_9CAUD|nr:hypothetical protein UFOVP1193_22 [uncultured Caudovirales phage]
MNKYLVEKNVPLPNINRRDNGRKTKYPWDSMEVGDSFHTGTRSPSNTMFNTVKGENQRHPGKAFVSDRDGDGFRVWRIR